LGSIRPKPFVKVFHRCRKRCSPVFDFYMWKGSQNNNKGQRRNSAPNSQPRKVTRSHAPQDAKADGKHGKSLKGFKKKNYNQVVQKKNDSKCKNQVKRSIQSQTDILNRGFHNRTKPGNQVEVLENSGVRPPSFRHVPD